MSARRYVTIWCDGPDCSAWCGNEETAAAARSHARSFGWRRVARTTFYGSERVDLCPACLARLRLPAMDSLAVEAERA